MRTLIQTLFFFLLTTQICFTQQDFWQLQGGPYGKEIIYIAEGGINTLFLSVSDGLLFKSINDGDSWQLTDYGYSLIQTIANDNSGIIYAGTQTEGVYRSTDMGNTWLQISGGLNNFNILSLSVTTTGHVYCGSAGGGIFQLNLQSTNWEYLGLANVDILSIQVDINGDLYAGTSGYSIYKSTNNGNDWTQLNAGIGDDRTVYSLALNSDGKIFAGTDLGIYRTSDGGQSWLQFNNGLQDTAASSILICSTDIILSLVGNNIYKSSDSGDSWQLLDDLGNESLCLSGSGTGSVFVGTILGVFRSNDHGTSWTRQNNGLINGENVNSITFNSTGSMFSALSSGIFRSDDDGINWQQTILRNENIHALLYTPSNGFMFAGTEYGITRSTDDGINWSEKAGFWYATKITLRVDPFGIIYAGYRSPGWWWEDGAVIKSIDAGENWIETGLNGPPINAMDVNLSGYILVARTDSGLYLSTNQGEVWVSKGLNDNTISSVLLTNTGCMFAATENGLLYRSCDDGSNWQNIASTEMKSINCIIKTGEGIIFIGDSTGVFRTTNNGDIWTQLISGLNDTNIQTLVIGTTGYLYAGSKTGFVYKSSEIVTDISGDQNEIPRAYCLFQNYPNPFNPSTTIKFTLPERSYIQLTVFDILGSQVAELVNEVMEGGSIYN